MSSSLVVSKGMRLNGSERRRTGVNAGQYGGVGELLGRHDLCLNAMHQDRGWQLLILPVLPSKRVGREGEPPPLHLTFNRSHHLRHGGPQMRRCRPTRRGQARDEVVGQKVGAREEAKATRFWRESGSEGVLLDVLLATMHVQGPLPDLMVRYSHVLHLKLKLHVRVFAEVVKLLLGDGGGRNKVVLVGPVGVEVEILLKGPLATKGG